MMREEVRAGRLDGECLNAVLEAAGHRVRHRAGPHVSLKTVSSRLKHLWARLVVKTRTGATLFAMRHGLAAAAGEPETWQEDGAVTRFAAAGRSVERIHGHHHDHAAASLVPQFARAGSFPDRLAVQDLARLGGALAADAQLRALLPAAVVTVPATRACP